MSEAVEQIIRIAAKGDGVTASGRHVKGTVPGDMVSANGIVERGPPPAKSPCRGSALPLPAGGVARPNPVAGHWMRGCRRA